MKRQRAAQQFFFHRKIFNEYTVARFLAKKALQVQVNNRWRGEK
jgi:hypothetical protein